MNRRAFLGIIPGVALVATPRSPKITRTADGFFTVEGYSWRDGEPIRFNFYQSAVKAAARISEYGPPRWSHQ